jgi:CheY-like chemotaxis protein
MAKILVIDDVPGVRRSIVGVLTRAGHEVEEAGDGLAGVELARRARPDLALVDMLMPEQDGLETLDQLRQEGLCGALVAMSGGGALVGAQDALAAATHHADASMNKPFENADLLALVSKLVKAGP